MTRETFIYDGKISWYRVIEENIYTKVPSPDRRIEYILDTFEWIFQVSQLIDDLELMYDIPGRDILWSLLFIPVNFYRC